MTHDAPAGDPDARLRARDAALAELAQRLDAAERACATLEDTTARQADEIARLSAQLLGDAPDVAELRARLSMLQAERDALCADPLWRVTAPLRRLGRGRRA